MRLRIFIGLVLTFVWNICALAQNKELKTEEDGFKWYLTSSDGVRGAQSESGKEIIPLQSGFDWISYDNGFLCGTIFSPDGDLDKTKNAYYDKKGNTIIALGRYDINYYEVPEGGKPAWFSVKKNGLQGACDITGKEIVPPVYTGLLYGSKGFEGKTENGNYNLLGITLPGHDIMAFVEKKQKTESDGFVWYELRDYPNYGAADKDGKILLPMSMQLTRVKYRPSTKSGKHGVFEVYKEDFVGVYDSQGVEILSPDKGYTYWKYIGNNENGYLLVNKGDLEYGFCDLNQNEIIAPGKYSYVHFNTNGFFEVKQGDYEGICDLNGHEIIAPNKYTSISHINYENEPQWFSVEKDGKEGAYNMYGRELVPALYSDLYYDNEEGFYCKNNGDDIALSVKITTDDSNSYSSASTSSSSNNTNYKYATLNDPNLVDNSEEISRCEKVIEELENQKLHCSYCNGTHKIPTNCNRCRGTGTIKMGYYTPQFFKCNYCGGTGRTYKPCIECQKTDVSISISRNMLKTYKETHGMTKETAAFYHEHNSKMAQMDRDYQNTINAIAEPYLNGTRKSNSSNSSTSSSSKTCTYCGGTGVSKIGILGSGGTGVAYTNAAGEDCPYCDEYDYKFHHHDRCTCKLK